MARGAIEVIQAGQSVDAGRSRTAEGDVWLLPFVAAATWDNGISAVLGMRIAVYCTETGGHLPGMARYEGEQDKEGIMGEPDLSGHPDEQRDAQPSRQSEIPLMPSIGPSEKVDAVPHPLIDGISPTIGWQFRSRADGGPAFMIIRRSSFGSLKAVESFPLTEDGWAAAWQSFIKRDAYAAQKVLTALKARDADSARLISPEAGTSSPSQETNESNARPLLTLYNLVLLGGYLPDMEVFAGKRHHVQFFDDRFWLILGRTAVPQVAVPYSEIEDVEIGGPGVVKTGGAFAGGGFGATGAIQGMAIASILNGFASRTSIKTILRIQGTGFELFLLHPGMTPEELRIELSRPLAARVTVKICGSRTSG